MKIILKDFAFIWVKLHYILIQSENITISIRLGHTRRNIICQRVAQNQDLIWRVRKQNITERGKRESRVTRNVCSVQYQEADIPPELLVIYNEKIIQLFSLLVNMLDNINHSAITTIQRKLQLRATFYSVNSNQIFSTFIPLIWRWAVSSQWSRY